MFIDSCVSAILRTLMQNPIVRILKRVAPLCLALWMVVDMGLDLNQSINYHRHAFSSNGTYQDWSQENYFEKLNATNTTDIQTVSKAYFYAATTVWFIPPFLVSVLCSLSSVIENKEYWAFSIFLKFFFKYEITFPYGRCFQSIVGLLVLPLDIIASITLIYFVIPFMATKSALKILWEGDKFDSEENIVFKLPAKFLPYLKCFEYLGEALPQLILALIFTANNWPFLLKNDVLYQGFPVPVSIISIVFSSGSLMIGLYPLLRPCFFCFWNCFH